MRAANGEHAYFVSSWFLGICIFVVVLRCGGWSCHCGGFRSASLHSDPI